MESKKTIFADHAEKLNQLGLAVIPCGDQTGKKPLVRWRHFSKKGVPSTAISKWVNQFPTANIGVLLGEASGIVVIDDDNNREPNEIFEEFGPTPIYVRTPSKGGHYYYRYNGEVSTNIASRRLEIKSTGSFIIVPPSISPNNGNTYEFVRGGFTLGFIDELPLIKPEALHNKTRQALGEINNGIPKGTRNTALFDYLRSIAYGCNDEQELYIAAQEFNTNKMEQPLGEKEVQNTVRSVWGYKITGTLVVPGEQYACTTLKDQLELSPDELWFLNFFKANHNGLRPEFVICVPALAQKYRFTPKRIRKARNGLVDKGFIRQTYIGGAGKGDTNKYEFVPKV